MPKVVSVNFKENGKVYYYDPGNFDVKEGDWVLVETANGLKCVRAYQGVQELDESELVAPLKNIQRIASQDDIERMTENGIKEKEAFEFCQSMIAEKELNMKLIEVEFPLDRGKMIFYFSADQRVDFRELVKDLAGKFKTRIEMKQISIREQAKMLGDLGPCGRPLCCSLYNGDFEPVSIRMAKDQNLSLNPLKISGICGRLMCCLRYEHRIYEEFKKNAPSKGKEVSTPEGKGIVIDQDVLHNAVTVDLGEGLRKSFLLREIE